MQYFVIMHCVVRLLRISGAAVIFLIISEANGNVRIYFGRSLGLFNNRPIERAAKSRGQSRQLRAE